MATFRVQYNNDTSLTQLTSAIATLDDSYDVLKFDYGNTLLSTPLESAASRMLGTVFKDLKNTNITSVILDGDSSPPIIIGVQQLSAHTLLTGEPVISYYSPPVAALKPMLEGLENTFVTKLSLVNNYLSRKTLPDLITFFQGLQKTPIKTINLKGNYLDYFSYDELRELSKALFRDTQICKVIVEDTFPKDKLAALNAYSPQANAMEFLSCVNIAETSHKKSKSEEPLPTTNVACIPSGPRKLILEQLGLAEHEIKLLISDDTLTAAERDELESSTSVLNALKKSPQPSTALEYASFQAHPEVFLERAKQLQHQADALNQQHPKLKKLAIALASIAVLLTVVALITFSFGIGVPVIATTAALSVTVASASTASFFYQKDLKTKSRSINDRAHLLRGFPEKLKLRYEPSASETDVVQPAHVQ